MNLGENVGGNINMSCCNFSVYGGENQLTIPTLGNEEKITHSYYVWHGKKTYSIGPLLRMHVNISGVILQCIALTFYSICMGIYPCVWHEEYALFRKFTLYDA